MMIYKQLNTGIKYQYTLPLRTAQSDVGKPLNDVVDRQLNAMTPLSDTPTQYSTHYDESKPPRRGKVGRNKPRRHYKWQISGFNECSKTCAGGTQSTVLVCVKESSGVKVADIYCKNIPKTHIRTITCNTKPCPPNWVSSAWSQCSASCGKGVQHRDFTCKQQISPNVQVSVAEDSCPPIVNEVKTQVCQVMTCTTWRVGRWSQCSTTCGKGIRNRQVHCVSRDETNLSYNDCAPQDKPTTEEICDLGSCSITWFTTEWSSHQCKDTCSSGIQSRKVFCPLSDATNCDVRTRPETTKPCPKHDELKCPGKWFVGPWSPCSVSCGKGVESRDIVCMMYVRGQYRPVLDFQCGESEKPNGQQVCQKQECGSECCSASCGSGTQTREIRCLSETQKASTNCLQESRSNTHQGCNKHDCHHDSSQKDSGCLDKFRNCHLVAQSRLCSYNYYRDACCQSCSRFTH
uniref:PLAC domain-containing protein n=1 Tax=Strigamia maritima TaxID=126957 RepID=T1IZW1_STRMM